MFDPREALESMNPHEEEPYDEEGLEAALYGSATKLLISKEAKKRALSLRLQESFRQRNKQALMEGEQAEQAGG